MDPTSTELKTRERADRQAPAAQTKPGVARKTRKRITIGKNPEEIFAFCREISNLPLFLKDEDDERSLEVVRERAGTEIVWRGAEDGQTTIEGTLRLEPAPAGRGTLVTLLIEDLRPAAVPRDTLAKLAGKDAATQSLIRLRRLKAWLETGEVPTTEGQSSGRDDERAPLKNFH